tara:strand:- start:41241 stop:41483 length:243 start_codon:yes stop_codon:yes gene_type:complete
MKAQYIIRITIPHTDPVGTIIKYARLVTPTKWKTTIYKKEAYEYYDVACAHGAKDRLTSWIAADYPALKVKLEILRRLRV